MIRVRKMIMLAGTKLRTRRVRLAVLLITMSMMFAGLVFIANVATGIVNSLVTFGKEGLGSRYLISARPLIYQPYGNDALINQVAPKQDQLIAQKKALAKKLNITYDPASDTSLYYTNQQVGPNASDVQRMLTGSPLAVAALNDQNKAIPGNSFADFTTKAKNAGATHFYRSANGQGFGTGGAGATTESLQVLIDGKEDYSTDSAKGQYSPVGVRSIETLGWAQISASLLQPFLLNGQTAKLSSDGSVPVIVPYSAAEQMLGLHAETATATAEQRLQRLIDVRQKIAGKTVQLCYRNQTSAQLLQKAIQQQAEIAANKSKADYSAPHLLYDLPGQACGATTIKSDKRTYDEKQDDANQQTFDDAFLPQAAADQGAITLRIVGITPDVQTGPTNNITSIFSNLLDSTIGYGWFSPAEAFTPGTLATKAQGATIEDQPLSNQLYYAEFSNLQAANNFIKQNNCDVDISKPGLYTAYNPNDMTTKCAAKHMPFSVGAYGNNAGAISSFQKSLWKILRFVILAVVVIAGIVMAGTFGKVIADSRRETAVFRALGASRMDISQIYLTYTLLVGLLVGILSLGLGSIGAYILNDRFSARLSVDAALVYNARDPHMHFTLVGYNRLYLLAIGALVLAVALVSALIPLITNMRRNPIRDMRDE